MKSSPLTIGLALPRGLVFMCRESSPKDTKKKKPKKTTTKHQHEQQQNATTKHHYLQQQQQQQQQRQQQQTHELVRNDKFIRFCSLAAL